MTAHRKRRTDQQLSEANSSRSERRSGGVPRFYAIATVAEAFDVSARTVRRWIASGDLIAHRVKGVRRIAESDLRAFLALHRES